jgi:hypothetical protein
MESLEDKQPTLTLVKANKSGQLKTLKPHHKQAILLHLQGCRLGEISQRTGLSQWWICRILKSDLARRAIAEYSQLIELEFKALQKKALDAVKDGLEHPDIRVRLQAADRWFKVCGRSFQGEAEEVTAEDVVRAIMESGRHTHS